MRPQLFKNENAFDKEFLQVMNETGCPISVLKGFVALESAFNPKAYRYEEHRKDASYGLAQILYQTAKGYGFTGKPEDLFDPYLSLKYGALFLKDLAKKYNNPFDLIASYNMGYPRKITETTQFIANIYKYPITYKTNPPKDWVYANQPYVDRVASYMAFYQALEKNDINKAWDIYNLIKKKRLQDSRVKYTTDILELWKL
ncbi:MAG: lytic transglycosylase domain-containing protein [Bacteroidales bacterium]|nr:lytic transglycosylase domain-containing protein [Bacteroidales bacterium]